MSFFEKLWQWVATVWSRPEAIAGVDELPGIPRIPENDPPRRAKIFEIDISHPGTVRAWLVRHQNPRQSDLVIDLVSVAQLRQDFAAGRMWRRSVDPFQMSSDRDFNDQLDDYLGRKAMPRLAQFNTTHLVLVFWRSRQIRELAPGRRRGYTIRRVEDIPCDLQNGRCDFGGQVPGDRYAIMISFSLALGIARFADVADESRWAELAEGWDWYSQIDRRAKDVFTPSHQMQPRHKP